MIKPLCWILLALGLTACASAPEQRLDETSSRTEFVASSYRLGVGDRVRVDVFREGDLSGEVGIESNGNINYPLIGYVPAVGLTPRELEQELVRRLRAGYLRNPDVRVAVARVDVDRRELNFRLVGRGRRPKAGMHDRRAAKPKGRRGPAKRPAKGKASKRRRGR